MPNATREDELLGGFRAAAGIPAIQLIPAVPLAVLLAEPCVARYRGPTMSPPTEGIGGARHCRLERIRECRLASNKHYGVYLANRHARAALTCSECGACRDWTR